MDTKLSRFASRKVGVFGAFVLIAGFSRSFGAETPSPSLAPNFETTVTGLVTPTTQAPFTQTVVNGLRSQDVSLRYIAASALSYALQPWRDNDPTTPKWLPGASLVAEATQVFSAVLPNLDYQTTPDIGLRRNAASAAGLIMRKVASLPEAAALKDKIQNALLRVVRSDPESFVVEAAIRMPAALDRKAALSALGENPSAQISRRFGQASPSDYTPVVAESGDGLNDLREAAAKAASLAASGRNLAENAARAADGPSISGTYAWGGGSDLLSALRGPVEYRTDFGGPGGPALPGPEAGVSSGWVQVTIDLKSANVINTVQIQTNGNVYTPSKIRVLIEVPADPATGKGARWVEAYKTDTNEACRGKGDDPGCRIPVSFPALIGSKVRLEFDSNSVERHVWLQRVGVSYEKPAVTNS